MSPLQIDAQAKIRDARIVVADDSTGGWMVDERRIGVFGRMLEGRNVLSRSFLESVDACPSRPISGELKTFIRVVAPTAPRSTQFRHGNSRLLVVVAIGSVRRVVKPSQ